jgi:RAT1-interacting protein
MQVQTSFQRIICFDLLTPIVWDSKPVDGGPINWVELKTSADIRGDRDMVTFERKLMKFWIQSFLLGVPKIIVGFRSPNGILERVEEMATALIPAKVKREGRGTWDGNMCINFVSELLDCKLPTHNPSSWY